MSERRFAAWVAPVAGQMRANREAIAGLARALPREAWERPSPNAGWTYRDLLAHLADDTDKNLQGALRMVAAGRPIASALFDDIDARNARGIEQRARRSVEELVAEIEADGAQFQDLLSGLRDEDEQLTQPEIRGTFGEFLREGLAQHDALHLAQLRTALAPSESRTR